MILFKKKSDLAAYLDSKIGPGKTIGFVPTMGALHQGHLSLIESSRKDNSITVSSIFVNPTQFNEASDYEKYPITIESDLVALEKAGCDLIFLPSVSEVYGPVGIQDLKHNNPYYDLGYLETILEGYYRPGHFQGVCMVVERLLQMVRPDNLYLGQKDYQQCMVITRLIEIMGQSDRIKVNICPTLREPDGLAMSSRNLRLDKKARALAPEIFAALSWMRKKLAIGGLAELIQQASSRLSADGFRVDYVEIADAGSLEPVRNWDGRQKLVGLVAAYLDEVRLIDNLLLN